MLYLTCADMPERVNAEALREKLNSNEYIDKICAKTNPDSVRASLAALELLAETMKLAGIDTKKLTLTRNERGRPSFKGVENIDFSLSHSKHTIACAVMIGEEARVGVDTEETPTDENAERIARRFFSDGERETVRQQGGDGFVEIWTKKEALVKYLDRKDINIKGIDTARIGNERLEIFEIEGVRIAVCRAKKSEERIKTAKIMLKS